MWLRHIAACVTAECAGRHEHADIYNAALAQVHVTTAESAVDRREATAAACRKKPATEEATTATLSSEARPSSAANEKPAASQNVAATKNPAEAQPAPAVGAEPAFTQDCAAATCSASRSEEVPTSRPQASASTRCVEATSAKGSAATGRCLKATAATI